MAKNRIYTADTGTEIILDVGQDITGATVSIDVLKPGGAVSTWAATVHTIDGAARYVRHTTIASDLDVAGVYRLQPVVALADGSWSGRGETAEIRVFEHHQ
ncbi:hypothetical protein [Solidesulfovibrio sp.]